MSVDLKIPVGRIVQGQLWKVQKKTDPKTGAPLLGKDGLQRESRFFAVAVAKTPGHTHWSQTQWGQIIWAEGQKAYPQMSQHPSFSWKIEDGDSTVPNKKMKRNCDREGHPGHWILKFSTEKRGPISTWNATGSAPMPGEEFMPGRYVEVFANVAGNTGDTPGVYLNPVMVALAGYGPLIEVAPDPSVAGFGQSALPPGASAVPLASTTLTPPAAALPGTTAPTAHGLPVVPAAVLPQSAGPLSQPVPQPAASPGSTPMTSPSSVVVQPNPAFLLGPLAPIAPAAPTLSPAALAAGHTYKQLRDAGHTDEQLRAAGYLA
jgi:hypothetical protein